MISIHNLRDLVCVEEYDFLVDRHTPVGNPYPLTSEENRDTVCDQYEEYFKSAIDVAEIKAYLDMMIKAYKKHNRLRLFCWCTPKRCHATTIRKWLISQLKSEGK